MSETGRRGLDKARTTLESALYGTALYRLSLRGKRPVALAFGPVDPWPGDPVRGAALVGNVYGFAGISVTGTSPWTQDGTSQSWLEAMHGFDWLRDLDAVGSAEARRHGRRLTLEWIKYCGAWNRLTWRPDILARRLVAWFSHSRLLLAEADNKTAEMILNSLAEQAKHLGRVATNGPDGARRITAIKGLIFAALCLPGNDRTLEQGISLLEQELERQISADGCHAARSPVAQLSVFCDLAELRGLIAAARRPACEPLRTAIDRMAPMLRFFRHGDGGLALFNGSREQDPVLIDRALAYGEAGGGIAIQRPPWRIRAPSIPEYIGDYRCRRTDGAVRRLRPWRDLEFRDEHRKTAHDRQLRYSCGDRRPLADGHARHRRPFDCDHQ